MKVPNYAVSDERISGENRFDRTDARGSRNRSHIVGIQFLFQESAETKQLSASIRQASDEEEFCSGLR